MAKKAKKQQEEQEDPGTPDTTAGLRLTDHPKAKRTIRAAKGWGGLAGFGLGLLLASRAGLPNTDVVLRALQVGIAGYLLTWALAVVVWKQIARAEVEELRQILVAAADKAEAEVARLRAEREGTA